MKKASKKEPIVLPSSKEIAQAYREEKYKRNFLSTIKSTIFMLIVVAAVAVLVAVLYLPILRIYGQSMKGSLDNGDIVVSVKGSSFRQGDIVAFYYNNNILVKRVIAYSGQWVDMDEEGNVYVNDQLLDEPYIKDKDFGETNIDLPYQVPDGRLFVMGDNRKSSIDSRNTTIGTIAEEQIVGKLVFKVWPMSDFGLLE
ncbi:signal peptidase I [Streptococcus suis]|uniref:Signal peptidase I n=1 Tax=Streptococcus suivaginalis TaxID=3028082 RepID=A0AA96ZZP1_9STRE|nr:signal peptidase I [Streptococcus sp. 29896]MCK4028391.1 signal peptidase I [Streptococcus suis]WNY46504.1 signal peptidase I [Streptococcus sp. 29896]